MAVRGAVDLISETIDGQWRFFQIIPGVEGSNYFLSQLYQHGYCFIPKVFPSSISLAI